MGRIPRYEQNPPPRPADSSVQPPTLLIATIEQSPDGAMKCLLPLTVRKKWLDHPVHGVEWRDVVQRFDRNMSSPDSFAAVAEAHEPASGVEESLWKDEPTLLKDLTTTYNVLATFPGRTPAINFIMVDKSPLQNTEKPHMETVQGQDVKIFIASPESDVTVTLENYVFAHGQASFVKAKKAEELLEKGLRARDLGSGGGRQVQP